MGRGLAEGDTAYLRCVSEGGVGWWPVMSHLVKGQALWEECGRRLVSNSRSVQGGKGDDMIK